MNYFSVVLARATIVTAPTPIKKKAGKSYFVMNFSPKHLMDKKVLKTIALIEFVEIRTRSAYGSTHA